MTPWPSGIGGRLQPCRLRFESERGLKIHLLCLSLIRVIKDYFSAIVVNYCLIA